MELTRRSVKVRIAAALFAVALLGVAGSFPGESDSNAGATLLGEYDLQTHKSGHPEPPGCQKDHKYGKKPKQKCPKHPP